ncbi:hypothetical protein T492DRAFT_855189 [Pavlovales sp. CCMP2436]|nr:hypothetical protein T492DRAFT_855189 [Pavlovales sp. CCMP2436]
MSDGSLVRRKIYKQVALLGGQLLRIYDGETIYALGELLRLPPGEWLYACPSYAEAVAAPLPRRSRLRLAPRAVLRCSAWGDAIENAHGWVHKLGYKWLRPEELLPMPLGYTMLVHRELPAAAIAELVYENADGLHFAATARARSAGRRRPASAGSSFALREALALLRSTAALVG